VLGEPSVDPNVGWEWEGQMKFWCREKRVGGSGGNRKGDEVMIHYCDIISSVKKEREWARGVWWQVPCVRDVYRG